MISNLEIDELGTKNYGLADARRPPQGFVAPAPGLRPALPRPPPTGRSGLNSRRDERKS